MSSIDEKLGGLSSAPSPLHSVNSSLQGSLEGGMGENAVENTNCFGKISSAWKLATQGSVVSSIFILLTTCVGAGILSLPYGFAQGGIVFSSVVFFIIMIMSIHVGSMLFAGKRYAAEVYPDKPVWGYADLAEIAYGTVGRIAVLLTIAILLFLALIAYMIYARDQLEAIVSFALTKTGHHPSCSPLVNCAVLMCMAFLPVFPVTLLRNLSPLQFTSYFSIICVAFVSIAMTVKTGLFWTQANATAIADYTIQYGPKDFNGSLTVISYCSLSFVCHFNLLPLQKELKQPVTKLKLYSIVVGSILIAYTLYNIVIFSSFFRFFGDIKEDVMVNYPKDDYLMTAARVALFFMLVTSYPVLLHPTRESINSVLFLVHDMIVNDLRKRRRKSRPNINTAENVKLLNGDDVIDEPVKSGDTKIPTLVWFSETWILFALSFLPASFIPNVGYVWNFVGSIGGVLVLYIYPSACYLRLRYVRYKQRSNQRGVSILSQYNAAAVIKDIIAWAILVTGLLLLIVENYQAISAVVNSEHDPTGLCFQLECKVMSGNFSTKYLDWL